MKQIISTNLLLLMFVFLVSCDEKSKPTQELNKENKTVQKQIKNPVIAEQNPKFKDAPSAITRTMIQDKKGDIWLATFEGVIKYDGKSFTNMTKDFTPSRFFSSLEDRHGNLWFGSIGMGVYKYDGKSFINFNTNDGLVDDRVTNIYEDKKGNLWFGTLGGASCYDGKTYKNYTTEQGLQNKDVNSIIEDKTGKFWFGTRGYASIYDGNTFTLIENEEGDCLENVRHIIKDKNDNMWLGGQDGLWRFDGRVFTNITKDFVGYMYEDRAGNIWTTSERFGINDWVLSRYDVVSLKEEKISSTVLQTGNIFLFGLLEDSDGNIWFGNLSGVYRYDGTTFEDFK